MFFLWEKFCLPVHFYLVKRNLINQSWNHFRFIWKRYLFSAELAMSQRWSAIFCATGAWWGKPIGRVRVKVEKFYKLLPFRCWNFPRSPSSHIFIRSRLSIMLFTISRWNLFGDMGYSGWAKSFFLLIKQKYTFRLKCCASLKLAFGGLLSLTLDPLFIFISLELGGNFAPVQYGQGCFALLTISYPLLLLIKNK